MAKKFKFDWASTVDKIKEQQSSNKNSYKDQRIYYPQWSDNGTAEAIIRFLPSKDTDIPWVGLYTHSVRGNGWYIENCPTTLKNDCPVCEANSEAWNNGDEETARNRKRKLSYYSNILVVKDPVNPANEGKVFLFRYGKKIHDKIMAKLDPEGGVRKPVMVFDYYDGANFALVVKKVKVGTIEMPNYDESNFETPEKVGDDDKIEKIHETLYSLKDFIDPKNFKTYNELKEKFTKVTGVKGFTKNPTTETSDTNVEVKPEVIPEGTEDGKEFDGTDEDFFAGLQDDK